MDRAPPPGEAPAFHNSEARVGGGVGVRGCPGAVLEPVAGPGPGRWPCESLRRCGLTRQKQRFPRALRRFGAGWRSTQRSAINQCGWWSTRRSGLPRSGAGSRDRVWIRRRAASLGGQRARGHSGSGVRNGRAGIPARTDGSSNPMVAPPGRFRSHGLVREAEALRCGQGCPHDRCGAAGRPSIISRSRSLSRSQPTQRTRPGAVLEPVAGPGPGRRPCESLRRCGLTRQKQRFPRASRRFGAGWRSTQRSAINQCGWWSTRRSGLPWSGAGCRLPGRGPEPPPGGFVEWSTGPWTLWLRSPEWSCGHPCPHRWLFEPDGRPTRPLPFPWPRAGSRGAAVRAGMRARPLWRGGTPVDHQPVSKPLTLTTHPANPTGRGPRPGSRCPGGPGPGPGCSVVVPATRTTKPTRRSFVHNLLLERLAVPSLCSGHLGRHLPITTYVRTTPGRAGGTQNSELCTQNSYSPLAHSGRRSSSSRDDKTWSISCRAPPRSRGRRSLSGR